MKIPKWKIRQKNGVTLSFFFVVMALENFSWLIPTSNYIIPRVLKYSDIGIFSAILWILYVAFGIRRSSNYRRYKFPGIYLVIIFLSAIAADYFFGQSLSLSFRQNRYIIICMLMYYAIMKALSSGKLLREDAISIMAFQAVIEIILFSLQYALNGRIQILHVITTTRYDSARLSVSYLLPLIFMYFCIDKVLNNRYRLLNLVYAFAGAFVLAGICKHRVPTVIVLGTIVAGYYFWKKSISTKMLVGVLIAVVFIGIIGQSTMMQDILQSNTNDSHLTLRFDGQLYYLNQLKRSPIVGFGEPNDNCYAAMAASGEAFHYYRADNGIVGFAYAHGLIGIVWLLISWGILIKQSFQLMKKQQKYQYFLYILFETGNLYIGMHWYYYYAFPFILCISLMSYDYFRMNEIR